jgi:hypothetical protein
VLAALGDAQLLIPRRPFKDGHLWGSRVGFASANDVGRPDSVPLRWMSTPEFSRWSLLNLVDVCWSEGRRRVNMEPPRCIPRLLAAAHRTR